MKTVKIVNKFFFLTKMIDFSLFGLLTFITVLCTFKYFLHSADKSFLGKIKCITKMFLLFNIKELYTIMKYVHKGKAIPLTRFSLDSLLSFRR